MCGWFFALVATLCCAACTPSSGEPAPARPSTAPSTAPSSSTVTTPATSPATAPTTAPGPAVPDARGPEARRRVQAGARLVDVRTPAEFAAGHIDGAVNVPVQELVDRRAELGPPSTSVVVYCGSGRRSAHAAALLREAGFDSVFDLGPMSAWPQP